MVSSECIPLTPHLCWAFDDIFYGAILLIHVEIGSREVGYRMPQIPRNRQRFQENLR